MAGRAATPRRAALAFLLVAACSPERPDEGPTPPDSPTAEAVWFARQRTLDFTGDGQPDTVELRATGRSPDSLRIVLAFRSAGELFWREEWASEYELVDPPPLADGTARAGYVRSRLERALASIEVEPFDQGTYESLANPVDSVLLREPPAHQISYAYGYETTVALVWDPINRELRLLHACC